MRYRFFHLPAYLLALCPMTVQADAALGEKLVRESKYTQALEALAEDTESPEAAFWRGRALMALERYGEAAINFEKVAEAHPLFPYAAKGIMYCAWKGSIINFVEAVAPLMASENKEIAALSTAAMAEYQLRHSDGGDTSALQNLKRMPEIYKRKQEEFARKQEEFNNKKADGTLTPEKEADRQKELAELKAQLDQMEVWYQKLDPILKLLQIEDLRAHGKYEEALAAATAIDENRELPVGLRQRARLAMAEIYYRQGKTETGEETIMLFIAANPDSPLLEEAFRRLVLHRGVISSSNAGYTTERLNDWSMETAHPHRSALALLMRQRAAIAHGRSADDVALSSLATAAISRPTDPAARTVIIEYARLLIAQNKTQEAARYLGFLKDATDPRVRFLTAACQPADSEEALQGFLACLDTAPADLQPAAAANALYCAKQSGNEAVAKELLARKLPRHARKALLLMLATLTQESDPAAALSALKEISTLSPTPDQAAEAALIYAAIHVLDDPAGTLKELQELDKSGQINDWDDEQKLRFYQLEMEAVDSLSSPAEGADETDITIARHILENTKSQVIATEFTFNLAARLAAKGQHTEAFELLENLAGKASAPNDKARALLLAAEEAARMGSMDYFQKSLELFQQCAAIPSPYRDRALAHRANVLMWTNRTDEALRILQDLLNRKDDISKDDLLLTYTVLADTYSMQGTSASRDLALQMSNTILETPDLTPEWRARALLQHAAFSSRYGMHEQALADYLHILETHPSPGHLLNRAQWYRLAYAGAGAVYEHLQLRHRDEAAALADQVADWLSVCAPKMADELGFPEKISSFRRWAKELRR